MYKENRTRGLLASHESAPRFADARWGTNSLAQGSPNYSPRAKFVREGILSIMEE